MLRHQTGAISQSGPTMNTSISRYRALCGDCDRVAKPTALHRATLQAYIDIDRLAVIQFQLLSHHPQLATLRRAEISNGLQHARLTDALLRLRPSGSPQKNSVGPDPRGGPGPCFCCASRNYENLQMISQRRKRFGLRACRLGCTFRRLYQAPSPGLWAIERRTAAATPSHARVMPYGPAESWLPDFSATP